MPLYEIYQDTFEIIRADTPVLKEAARRLRYQIYCIENAFESPADHPGGLEIDPYDDRAVHSLLIHRASGMLVGNVRIVLPNLQAPDYSFPMQRLVSSAKLHDPARIPLSCEISRFCISRNFRKRDGDGPYTGVFLGKPAAASSRFSESHRQRIIPFTALGLVRAIFEMAIDNNAIWGYAVLEPQLIRLLNKLGIRTTLVGPAVTYHGKRYPVEMNPLEICESVKRKHLEIWKILTDNGRIVGGMENLVATLTP